MDALSRLRRLQAATLVALVATLGILAGDRIARRLRPPGPAPDIDAKVAAALDAQLETRLAGALDAKLAGALDERIAAAVEKALAERPAVAAPAPAPARPAARAVAFAEAWLCRIRNDRHGLAYVLAAAGGGFAASDGDLPAGSRKSIELRTGVRIPILRGAPLPLARGAHGLLLVEALVRTDNGIREDGARPQRLLLACAEPTLGEQSAELAGSYFHVEGALPTDALLKTAASPCAFVVTESSRLEIIVDGAVLAQDLRTGGRLDILLRLGPLVEFDGEPRRE